MLTGPSAPHCREGMLRTSVGASQPKAVSGPPCTGLHGILERLKYVSQLLKSRDYSHEFRLLVLLEKQEKQWGSHVWAVVQRVPVGVLEMAIISSAPCSLIAWLSLLFTHKPLWQPQSPSQWAYFQSGFLILWHEVPTSPRAQALVFCNL